MDESVAAPYHWYWTRWHAFKWKLPHPIFMVFVWKNRPWRCKLGRHIFDYSQWGFGGCKVDFFCRRCQAQIGSMPVDEVPDELRDRIAGMWQAEPRI